MHNAIFISHSSKDRKAAVTICQAVEARGYRCWLSSRDVDPGQNYQEAIVDAVRNAPMMILVFSANANNSGEIKKELALASQSNLTVIPVRIEDVIPSGAFTYELATRQWIDVFGDWEADIARLLGQIEQCLPPDGSATQLTPIPTPQRRKLSPSVLLASAGALALFLVAGLAWYMRAAPKPAPAAAAVASLQPVATTCPNETQVKASLTNYINKDYWTPSQRDIWKISTISPLSFGSMRFGSIIQKQVEYGRSAQPVCPVRVEYSFSTVSVSGEKRDTKMGENKSHLFYLNGFGEWIFKTE